MMMPCCVCLASIYMTWFVEDAMPLHHPSFTYLLFPLSARPYKVGFLVNDLCSLLVCAWDNLNRRMYFLAWLWWRRYDRQHKNRFFERNDEVVSVCFSFWLCVPGWCPFDDIILFLVFTIPSPTSYVSDTGGHCWLYSHGCTYMWHCKLKTGVKYSREKLWMLFTQQHKEFSV